MIVDVSDSFRSLNHFRPNAHCDGTIVNINNPQPMMINCVSMTSHKWAGHMRESREDRMSEGHKIKNPV